MEALRGHGVKELSYHLLPDDEEALRALFLRLHTDGNDLVVSTGGTGLSPRDRTVEALYPVLERELPGAMEASRAYGQDRTPYAMLSRGIAGHRGKTLYVTLPGSSGGVRDGYTALFPALFHASHVLSQGPSAAKAKAASELTS
jgi:molybdenum cofactor synthesis domain-containing protein